MCELFGVSAARPVEVNDYLRRFYSHSDVHKDGWGLALFYGGAVSLEKEPVKALQSAYLKERLHHRIAARTLMAHIRLASMGELCYENCHPFVQQDNFGRRWTLAHNGTIFHGELTDRFFYQQEGKTDSERILLCLLDRINTEQMRLGRALNDEERFAVTDALVRQLAPGNKLNLLIYDGDLMYIHTNFAGSLYYCQKAEDELLVSTQPFEAASWQPVPFTTLLAYREDHLAFTGTCHGHEYIQNDADMKYLYIDSASL